MTKSTSFWTLALLCLASATGPARAIEIQQVDRFEYREICDASAAVAITDDAFLVASDEDNILRVFRSGSSAPITSFDWTETLGVDADNPEADIEGATR